MGCSQAIGVLNDCIIHAVVETQKKNTVSRLAVLRVFIHDFERIYRRY